MRYKSKTNPLINVVEESLCKDHRCTNGATCSEELNQSTYTCSCPQGFTGTFCEGR